MFSQRYLSACLLGNWNRVPSVDPCIPVRWDDIAYLVAPVLCSYGAELAFVPRYNCLAAVSLEGNEVVVVELSQLVLVPL